MSRKQALIRGTAVLTVTSLSTRFMGFFYRMFLSHTFGEENVGLYQLVFPVYALGISLSCAGMELALSRCVAREAAAGRMQKARELLKTSLTFYFFHFLYDLSFHPAECRYHCADFFSAIPDAAVFCSYYLTHFHLHPFTAASVDTRWG